MQIAINFVVETATRYLSNQFDHPNGAGKKLDQVVIPVVSQSLSVAAFFSELATQLPSYGLEGIAIGNECLRIGPVVIVRYRSPIEHRGDTSIGALVEDNFILNEEWHRTLWNSQLTAKRFFKFEVGTLIAALIKD